MRLRLPCTERKGEEIATALDRQLLEFEAVLFVAENLEKGQGSACHCKLKTRILSLLVSVDYSS